MLDVGVYSGKVLVSGKQWNYPLSPEDAVALAKKLVGAAIKAADARPTQEE